MPEECARPAARCCRAATPCGENCSLDILTVQGLALAFHLFWHCAPREWSYKLLVIEFFAFASWKMQAATAETEAVTTTRIEVGRVSQVDTADAGQDQVVESANLPIKFDSDSVADALPIAVDIATAGMVSSAAQAEAVEEPLATKLHAEGMLHHAKDFLRSFCDQQPAVRPPMLYGREEHHQEVLLTQLLRPTQVNVVSLHLLWFIRLHLILEK